MKTENYTTSILVDQTPEEVFNSVNDVRGWWSEQIEGRTDALHEVFNYHYQDVHRCTMKIVEFVPNTKVVWLVEDNYFNFVQDQTEWKGTRISFEIAKKGNQTELVFTHEGLVPAYECYNICSDAWSNYVQVSLKALIENGKGNPNPYQTAIDSAATLKTNAEQGAYTRTFFLDKSPASVFHAINDVTKWWCTAFAGSSEKLGDEFEVRFGDVHYSRHKVVESLPFKRIVWLVTDSKLNFVEKEDEWVGTTNVFEISTEDGKTKLTFTHVGLDANLECFSNCTKGWDQFIAGSLLPFIQEGEGRPFSPLT